MLLLFFSCLQLNKVQASESGYSPIDSEVEDDAFSVGNGDNEFVPDEYYAVHLFINNLVRKSMQFPLPRREEV